MTMAMMNDSDDEDEPNMDLYIFGGDPPEALGKSPEGKNLYTEEQLLERLKKKAKASYSTPEKKPNGKQRFPQAIVVYS